MPSCRSCLVLIDQGIRICPLCGADQMAPVDNTPADPFALAEPASPSTDWRVLLAVSLTAILFVTALYWINFGRYSVSTTTLAAQTAAQSLRNLREGLSIYALSAKDSYPASLDSLGNRLTLAAQAADSAGYQLAYTPRPSSGDGILRSFTILARPGKSGCLNLFVDETGVVRATSDDRPANRYDPPL